MTGETPIARRVLALFGADPDVFLPVARMHGLIVRRRAGLVRNRGALAQASPFRMLCLFALLYGIFGVLFLVEVPARILGAGLAVAIGCLFLLMVVVTDYFDILVNPREQLVLGAHPHDDRSILLAKLWVVGRTLGLLFALLSVPPFSVVAVRDGVLPAALFLAGSAAAALTVCMVGLYAGVAVIALFGRAGFERVMPWLQMAFQFSYFLFIGGQRLLKLMTVTTLSPAAAWSLPSLWFLAPLQAFEEGGFSMSTAGRTVLAAAALGSLTIGATRWLGSRVGERLLEPIQRRAVRSASAPVREPPAGRPARRGGIGRVFGVSERRRLFDLLRVHLRADWRTRSEFFMTPILCAFLLFTSGKVWTAWIGLGVAGWFLLASMDVLTRSPRPELLWFVLVSPVDRARFSERAVDLMRFFQLLPVFLLFAAIKWKAIAPDLAGRLLFLALLAAYGDLLILAGRGIFPEFPFSRPGGAESTTGRRMVVLLVGSFASAVVTAALYQLARRGNVGMAAAIGLLAVAHFPVGAWMRRRVETAADELELQPGTVA
ncbi:MAG: hypothetical protein M3167_05685 [Acidobacteriota bacterium]|nr:hypothetical protein [Acidobacteriota bacterium]